MRAQGRESREHVVRGGRRGRHRERARRPKRSLRLPVVIRPRQAPDIRIREVRVRVDSGSAAHGGGGGRAG